VPILTDDDFTAIRAAIDLSLDEGTLPDDVIALPIYRGRAEARVLARDPNAASYTYGMPEYDAVKQAAILFAASLLAPIVLASIPTSETIGTYKYNLAGLKPEQLAAALSADAELALTSYLRPAAPSQVGPVFARRLVATGRRGR
jgi:hypothetical protein